MHRMFLSAVESVLDALLKQVWQLLKRAIRIGKHLENIRWFVYIAVMSTTSLD